MWDCYTKCPRIFFFNATRLEDDLDGLIIKNCTLIYTKSHHQVLQFSKYHEKFNKYSKCDKITSGGLFDRILSSSIAMMKFGN